MRNVSGPATSWCLSTEHRHGRWACTSSTSPHPEVEQLPGSYYLKSLVGHSGVSQRPCLNTQTIWSRDPPCSCSTNCCRDWHVSQVSESTVSDQTDLPPPPEVANINRSQLGSVPENWNKHLHKTDVEAKESLLCRSTPSHRQAQSREAST